MEIQDKGTPCYCPEHLKEYYTKNRSRYVRHKYGRNWPRIREHKLYVNKYCECKDPDCGPCGGSHEQCGDTLATEVDHLVRFSRWQNKDSAHKHLQSLCKPCHSAKTSREVRNVR